MISASSAFVLRPFTERDLPLLHRWLNAPHVRPWFGGGRSMEEVVNEYLPALDEASPIHVFIAVHAGREVAMVSWERMGDSPDFQKAYGVDDPDSANCDILIGEIDAAHRGLGSSLIRVFVERVIFADSRITTCIIDPQTDNAIAIRAYEKAGFRFLRVEPDDGEGNAVYLMERRREAVLDPQADGDAIVLRPAREAEVALATAIDHDACTAFDAIGWKLEPPSDHPFVLEESARWAEAARAHRMLLACPGAGDPVGFSAVGFVDGRPYVHQVSVRLAWARRGIGRALVERAKRWSEGQGELWLTTYDHVVWNRPWYERLGFANVDPSEWGDELRAIVERERAVLPAPEHRVVMRYRSWRAAK